jgi:hypothetical protein
MNLVLVVAVAMPLPVILMGTGIAFPVGLMNMLMEVTQQMLLPITEL